MAVHRRQGCVPDGVPSSHESAPGIRFSVDALGIVRTTLSGTLTYPQLLLHIEARERAGVLARPELVDARDTRIELSSSDVQALAALAREIRRRTPIGPTAVVARDDLVYGIARMYAGFDAPDSAGFAVFRSMAEAEAWLEEVK